MLAQILSRYIVGMEYSGWVTFRKHGAMVEKQVSAQSDISSKQLQRGDLIFKFEQWVWKFKAL